MSRKESISKLVGKLGIKNPIRPIDLSQVLEFRCEVFFSCHETNVIPEQAKTKLDGTITNYVSFIFIQYINRYVVI